MRRWQEIKIRQHRLRAEADNITPAHIEQIMKSGFSLTDIKGLHRNYSEDAVESDEVMKTHSTTNKSTKSMPSRPPRKGSLSRNMDTLNIENSKIFNIYIQKSLLYCYRFKHIIWSSINAPFK